MDIAIPETTEILEPLRHVAPAVAGPGQVVIDNETQTISFEHKSPALLLAEANRVYNEASDLAPCIDCDEMYAEGATLLKAITDSFKTLDETRLASTKPLREMVEQINADYKPAIERRKEAGEILKRGMLAYDAEVERKRQQAEAEARQRATEERRIAEEAARAARQRAEEEAAAARQQGEQRAAEERRIAEENARRMLTEANELEAADNDARAAQLRSEANAILGIAEESAQTALFEGEQAAAAAVADAEMEADSFHAVAQMVTPSAPTISRPRAAGVSTRKVYAARVIDQKALLAHVLANYDALNHLVSIELNKVSKLAADQKERFNLPGCELVTENAMAARRR